MSTRLGDIWQLGNHRLLCGDAGDPQAVARLFDGEKPDLVFTSPPYDQQRDYTQPIGNWRTLMRRVFADALPAHRTTQVLVNLGMVHREGEWQPYWDPWIADMREAGWRRFGWYVWDKVTALPGTFGGRPAPCFEFIFHFNKIARSLNKTVDCKTAGKSRGQSKAVQRTGRGRPREWVGTVTTQPTKIPPSVFKYQNRGSPGVDHPAVFPVALPAEIIKAYTDPGELVYDPFCGSGTSIIAAEHRKRRCYAVDIAPEYCDIAVARWVKLTGQMPKLVAR